MPEIETDGYVMITLSEEEITEIGPDGNGISVECPVTGETIYLDTERSWGGICDCCGQERPEPEITPYVQPEVLRDGRMQMFTHAHTRGDITIIIRGDWEVRRGSREHLRS